MEPIRFKEVFISLLGAGAITVGALTFTGGLTPQTDNNIDLGTGALRYANSYVVTSHATSSDFGGMVATNATTTNATSTSLYVSGLSQLVNSIITTLTGTNGSFTTVTSTNRYSAATSTHRVNNRNVMLLTGSSATGTFDFSPLDTCFAMKGSGATTYIRIDATGSMVTSTTACPTSP